MTAGWACTAYGPEAAGFDALCFVAVPGTRKCRDEDECREVMTGQRQRVFRRISEMAASGDETGAFLEGKFSSPDQILGGEDSGEGSRP